MGDWLTYAEWLWGFLRHEPCSGTGRMARTDLSATEREHLEGLRHYEVICPGPHVLIEIPPKPGLAGYSAWLEDDAQGGVAILYADPDRLCPERTAQGDESARVSLPREWLIVREEAATIPEKSDGTTAHRCPRCGSTLSASRCREEC